MTPDILNSLEKPGLFEKFKVQVHKDFELAGVADFMPLIESNNLAHLKAVFFNSILKLEIGNALKNLLYRIDITELQIKQASQKDPETPLQQLLAELMIKRILQKVVLKEMYSK
jgi:3-polyprenyl-4-hydroxybenzoate decarboxylase